MEMPLPLHQLQRGVPTLTLLTGFSLPTEALMRHSKERLLQMMDSPWLIWDLPATGTRREIVQRHKAH